MKFENFTYIFGIFNALLQSLLLLQRYLFIFFSSLSPVLTWSTFSRSFSIGVVSCWSERPVAIRPSHTHLPVALVSCLPCSPTNSTSVALLLSLITCPFPWNLDGHHSLLLLSNLLLVVPILWIPFGLITSHFSILSFILNLNLFII